MTLNSLFPLRRASLLDLVLLALQASARDEDDARQSAQRKDAPTQSEAQKDDQAQAEPSKDDQAQAEPSKDGAAATEGRKIDPTQNEPKQAGSPPPPAVTGTGFAFGSYGRVGIGIDGRGRQGYATNVISHGSRLESPPYLELVFYYGGQIGQSDARWRIVVAPAFNGDLFHYNGSFSSRFAVRSAYAETDGLGLKGLNIWVGSRQLRGDDIYLLDYWPLDNLNTVGGGASLRRGKLYLQIHAGLNRLDNPAQAQVINVPARGLGPPGQALVLDRPRSIASFKGTYHFGPPDLHHGLKVSAYAEVHVLPEGQRVFVTQQRTERLPVDTGFVIGGQLGGWLRPATFFNLFFRYAGGLGALGELTAPVIVDQDRRTARTREFVAALSANWEASWVGVNTGAFFRTYREPQPGAYRAGDYNEGIIAVRPHFYLSKYFQVATEVSYQQRQYGGVDQIAGRRLSPKVFRASVLPLVSPNGRGTYSRPIIYAVGTLSVLDEDAQLALFDRQDIRFGNQNVFYIGLGAEWWFQSTYR